MKRIIFILSVMVFLLSGCAKQESPNTEPDTQVESQVQSDTETEMESQATDEAETETTSKIEIESEVETETETETESEIEKIQYTYTAMDATMYTTSVLNVRDLPSTDGEKLGELAKNEAIKVTGKCNETGWYRIAYNQSEGYVSNAYVVKEAPVVDISSWVKNLKIAGKTTQMIVVAAKDTYATVSMHTKDANGVWKEEFSVTGRLGRNGIGKEREGDGKTPVGVYTFMSAFGIKENPGVSVLPYLKVDETHHWVDDPNSKYYNQCVSTKDVEIDWVSSEHLYKYEPSYNYALALNYNETCVPGVGCAIFLHCPSATFGTTAGCIAIPEENMIQAMRLLQKDCVIIIDSEKNIWNY